MAGSGSRSIYKGSDAVPVQECDVCLTQNITSEAVSYCPACGEYLCQSCEKVHKGSRATRDHFLLTGSSLPTASTRTKPALPIMLCEKHKTMTLDVYCKTHDDVICTMCKMSNHKKCNTVPVNSQTSQSNVAHTLKNVSKSLADLTNRVESLKQTRLIKKSTLNKQIKACFQDLKQFRNDMNDKFDILEKKMAAEFQNIEKERLNELDSQVSLANDVLHQLEDKKKSIIECQKTRDVDVMFVGMKIATSRMEEYMDVISNIEKDDYQTDIHFQPNDAVTDMIQHLDSLGTVISTKQSNEQTPTSVLDMSVIDKQEIDVGPCTVWGCTFMSDGHLVLGCWADGLKLFDKHFKLKSQIDIKSCDVSAIDDTDVIVTQGVKKQLQVVQVLPDMKVKRTLNMDRLCDGVDVCGGEIYVTCHDHPGNGEVQVLNMDGTLQRRLGVDKGKHMFIRPIHVKVSRDCGMVFVSDMDTNTVTCLNQQGHVIYTYSDGDLQTPTGICVDGRDNLLVCGVNSHNVHVVRQDGRQEKILLSKNDGLEYPVCISYRDSDGCLVVGLHEKAGSDKKLIAYTTK